MVRHGDKHRLGYRGPGVHGAGGLREFPMNDEEQNGLCPQGDLHVHTHTYTPMHTPHAYLHTHTPAHTHHTHTHVHTRIHSSERQVQEQVQI